MRQFQDEPVGVEASELVTGNRQEAYGDPLENYERQALFITAILNSKLKEPVTRREAMHIMISLKQCRDLTTPLRDNEVDICGYAHLLQMDREDSEDFDQSRPIPDKKSHKVKRGTQDPNLAQRHPHLANFAEEID